MSSVFVNVYEVGQAYGGPEEGGWWFSTGVPITSILVERTEQDALEALIEQGFTEDQVRAFWEDHVRYGDPEWIDVDQERFAKALSERIDARAERIAEEWRERYPSTGRQYSVNGGEDYNVVIEETFARAYPEETPFYE